MNAIITLTTAGADTGPFNIYSDVDGYLSAFENNVSKAILMAGLATSNMPNGTNSVKIHSSNPLCNNFIIINI